jgi:hypothetical protein
LSDLDPHQVSGRGTGYFHPCFPTDRPVFPSKNYGRDLVISEYVWGVVTFFLFFLFLFLYRHTHTHLSDVLRLSVSPPRVPTIPGFLCVCLVKPKHFFFSFLFQKTRNFFFQSETRCVVYLNQNTCCLFPSE